jgi:pimeloyl-ACP methyl ester carboxylesterase
MPSLFSLFTDPRFVHATAPLRLALEGRAGWECGAMVAAQPLLALAPRGDGHPVLTLPLMLGNDLTMQPLRSYLAARGYRPYPWGLGVNLGPRGDLMARCLARLRALHEEHGRRVSLIGWSLGGLYARELAKELPDAVRCVITLGTPFTGQPRPDQIWQLYGEITGDRIGLPTHNGRLDQAPPVPTTSIYSRTDGIVPWTCSVAEEGALVENIEVESSHLGLGANPLSYYAIADRLAQPEGAWRPFERSGMKAWLYPDPTRSGARTEE